ncbi:hypothetical protein C9374_013927 [Naegleria lovaniensis]|uniref:Methyltransferase domain-containing protein n=1 Tax=Naegleria lovaniensis TaxID=51637 RepID=A0AA88KUR1_NAELO|nr:uncharacterized protein C9374_013927 [Naegleria lovaniensis]KAG2389367.1 hypothetical protein C9374_013927 [Naegleria lovaniensis]
MAQKHLNNDHLVGQDDFYANVFKQFLACSKPQSCLPEYVSTHVDKLVHDSSLNHDTNAPLRVLSVGCGHGARDVHVLKAIHEQRPHIQFDYVGVDINSVLVQEAQQVFCSQHVRGYVSECQFVVAPIEDYLERLNPSSEHGTFDLILMLHCLYYIPHRKHVLAQCVDHLSPNGKLMILHQSPAGINNFQNLCNPLFEGRKCTRNLQFNSMQVEHLLNDLEVPYSMDIVNATLNVSNCFVNPHDTTMEQAYRKGLQLLSFMLERDMREESEEVKQQVLDLLSRVSVKKHHTGEYWLFHPQVFLVVSKKL